MRGLHLPPPAPPATARSAGSQSGVEPPQSKGPAAGVYSPPSHAARDDHMEEPPEGGTTYRRLAAGSYPGASCPPREAVVSGRASVATVPAAGAGHHWSAMGVAHRRPEPLRSHQPARPRSHGSANRKVFGRGLGEPVLLKKGSPRRERIEDQRGNRGRRRGRVKTRMATCSRQAPALSYAP